MPDVEQLPNVEYFSGIGVLCANHHTYLGDVAYVLAVVEAPPGEIAIAGEFAFVAAPRDVSDYTQLSLELAAGDWLAIDLKYHDPPQNIYSFVGIERYRERGA